MLASIPLLLLSLSAWFYTTEERSLNPPFMFKGLITGLPAAGIWWLLALVVRPEWGNRSIIPVFWLLYWLFPIILAFVAWGLTNRFSSLMRPEARRLLAFLLPFSASFFLIWLARVWGQNFAPPVLILPLLYLSSIMVLSVCLELFGKRGLPSGLLWLALWLLTSFLSALAFALFYLRHELVALLLSVATAALGAVFSCMVLKRRYS